MNYDDLLTQLLNPTILWAAGSITILLGAIYTIGAILGDSLDRESRITTGFLIMAVGTGTVFLPKFLPKILGADTPPLVEDPPPTIPAPPPQEPPVAPAPIDSHLIMNVLMVAGVCVVALGLLLGIIFGARLLWQRFRKARASAVLTSERKVEMRGRIDAIADRIGRLQSDPVEALEHYALFETEFAESTTFWTQWISVTDQMEAAERLGEIPAGLRGSVADVERAWKSALANSERLGISAVGPDRSDRARRAVKSIRLAQGTTSEAEAALAWKRAADLLAELHLAHLPSSAGAVVESGRRAAITGTVGQ